jgi:hypothetical protein
MLNSGKKFRALSDKINKYSNSRVVRKQIYNKNNKGPNIGPCGTPDWTFSIFDSANANLTF